MFETCVVCICISERKQIKLIFFHEAIPSLFSRIFNEQALKTYPKYVNFMMRTVLSHSMPIKISRLVWKGNVTETCSLRNHAQ